MGWYHRTLDVSNQHETSRRVARIQPCSIKLLTCPWRALQRALRHGKRQLIRCEELSIRYRSLGVKRLQLCTFFHVSIGVGLLF